MYSADQATNSSPPLSNKIRKGRRGTLRCSEVQLQPFRLLTSINSNHNYHHQRTSARPLSTQISPLPEACGHHELVLIMLKAYRKSGQYPVKNPIFNTSFYIVLNAVDYQCPRSLSVWINPENKCRARDPNPSPG